MAGFWLPTDPVEDIPSMRVGFASSLDASDAPNEWEGLAGNWAPFLGNQGSVLYDLSGYGNHGILTNMSLATAWTIDARGPALSFDGVDDTVITVDDPLDISGDMTISAWFKTTSTIFQFIVSKYHAGEDRGWFLYTDSGQIYFDGRTGTGNYQSVGSGAVNTSDGAWHHGVGMRQGSVWKIYFDGILKNSATNDSGSFANSRTMDIGRYVNASGTPSSFFNGQIDDMRIYNRAFSDAEVLAIYQDPYAKHRLRPRRVWAVTVGETLSQPLIINQAVPRSFFW